MRFLADEGVESRIVNALQSHGHDVVSVGIDLPMSIRDERILEHACRDERILITHDKDFGELVFRHRRPHAGVILMRLGAATTRQKIALVLQVIARNPDIENRFVVITTAGSRIR